VKRTRPSTAISTTVVLLLSALWGYLRLGLFHDLHFPLTFVLPLLVGVWSGQRWQVWLMAGLFSVMSLVKASLLFPSGGSSDFQYYLFLASINCNILVGAAVVHVIIRFRADLETRNATVSAQNAELEAQAEELSQQNEEIRAQAEELAQQNEEIGAQSEEVARQNEDLLDLNHRLTGREEILQGLLQASQELDSIPRVMDALCRRTLSVIGAPAAAVAVLEQRGQSLEIVSQTGSDNMPPLPRQWPIAGSIAGVVLNQKRTAYVSDLTRQLDLAQPFEAGAAFKSVLATPVSLAGSNLGLLVACSAEPAHWTEEQFRVIEWVAGQCGLIMESLQHRQALEEHARTLEKAHAAKDTFLAMLSHELRTPLTPILVTSEMLEHDSRLPDEIRGHCRMIRRNVGVQCRLIDDLLDLTRISRGKIELTRQPVPIATLLRDTAQIVSSDLKAKSQTLNLDVAALDGCTVIGDEPRLQQVFWNLLKNAIKFSNPGASVSILGRLDGQRVVVEVSDQGCGIGADDLERVFLPFEQTQSKPRNANDGGLGLGLTIARAIVDKHGGRISAQSNGANCGSRFIVELPSVSSSEASFRPGVADLATGRDAQLNPVRILLVEDHLDTGRAIAGLLRSFAYHVEHAECAADAMRLFENGRFALVISDLGLPDGNGLVLLRRIRLLRPDIPAICISGYGMDRDIDECHEAGFRAHLTKPIEPARLKATIERLLAENAEIAPPTNARLP
jgi:signal transduction histidine kinase/ActR/RegA family two-component response regulator